MPFFGWMFWLLPFFFFLMIMRRRRWERARARPPREGDRDQRDREQQRSYIDALDTRVSQLEERLDFTERPPGRPLGGSGPPLNPGRRSARQRICRRPPGGRYHSRSP